MKRFFLVEADTEFHAMFAYELTQLEPLTFERPTDVLICQSDPEKFFGELNTLCITRTKLREAPPIKLVEPMPANIQVEPPDEAPKQPSAADLDKVAEEESTRQETLGVLAKGIAQTRSEILTDSDIPF